MTPGEICSAPLALRGAVPADQGMVVACRVHARDAGTDSPEPDRKRARRTGFDQPADDVPPSEAAGNDSHEATNGGEPPAPGLAEDMMRQAMEQAKARLANMAQTGALPPPPAAQHAPPHEGVKGTNPGPAPGPQRTLRALDLAAITRLSAPGGAPRPLRRPCAHTDPCHPVAQPTAENQQSTARARTRWSCTSAESSAVRLRDVRSACAR